ncbi:hypothetical protein NPA08_04185 [Mycoplasmopsis citelli]|uniref:Uncharacterized protein n=1 Tax=Mycoplasmopsis citelli TaxID=171281 RepID=A0A449B2N3_9BACT|nr:hypothetical protein [Mycoplasmopsis citelli]UUD36120.1 hypothetical protein NPA08_04185 [Mycoplasmopsis citelli]VEU74831.1 Uncharacterised protein [Mycoplasmopsis citelli]
MKNSNSFDDLINFNEIFKDFKKEIEKIINPKSIKPKTKEKR